MPSSSTDRLTIARALREISCTRRRRRPSPCSTTCAPSPACGARVHVQLSAPAEFDSAWHRATGSPS
ncbi:MAG TPA: hypothetical protein VMX54_05465 [Vicinamibacteria bacterium]|nr:hypothetical protein [Vicinamibacteria bacterium]